VTALAGRARLQADRPEIVFPLPMAVLMKAARLLPVGLWSAAMQRSVRR
jgi:hypothetical protein